MSAVDQDKTPCPLCGVLCSSSKRLAHLKHCSQRLQLRPEQLIAAAQLQAKYEEERKALGLPSVKAPPPSKREGQKKQQAVSKWLKEPKDKAEADLQMALAISASMQPAAAAAETMPSVPSGGPPPVIRKVGKKTKDAAPAPALIMVTSEVRQQKLEERVAALLTAVLPKPAQEKLQKSQGEGSRLWNLSNDPSDSDAFYVPGLLSPGQGSKAGSKLWHLSQVAGRKSLGENTFHDLGYSLEAGFNLESKNAEEDVKTIQELMDTRPGELDCTQGGFCSVPSPHQENSPSVAAGSDSDIVVELVKALSPKKGLSPGDDIKHARDLLRLVGDPVFSDATVLTADGEIPLHKALIYARCPSLFEGNLESSVFDLSCFSLASVKGFLGYLYAGVVENIQDKIGLLHLAQRFGLKHLEKLIDGEDHLQEFGVGNLSKYLEEERNFLNNISNSRRSLGHPSDAGTSSSWLSKECRSGDSHTLRNADAEDLNKHSSALAKHHKSPQKRFTALKELSSVKRTSERRESSSTCSVENKSGTVPLEGSSNCILTCNEKKKSDMAKNGVVSSFKSDMTLMTRNGEENEMTLGNCNNSFLDETFDDFLSQLKKSLRSNPTHEEEREREHDVDLPCDLKTNDLPNVSSVCDVIAISSDSEEQKTDALKHSPVTPASPHINSSPELFGDSFGDDLATSPEKETGGGKSTDFGEHLVHGKNSFHDDSCPAGNSPEPTSQSNNSANNVQLLRLSRPPCDDSLFLSESSEEQKLTLTPENASIRPLPTPNSRSFFTELSEKTRSRDKYHSMSTSSQVARKSISLSSPIAVSDVSDTTPCGTPVVASPTGMGSSRSCKKTLFGEGKGQGIVRSPARALPVSPLSVSSSSAPSSPVVQSLSERLAVKHALIESPRSSQVSAFIKRRRTDIEEEDDVEKGKASKSSTDGKFEMENLSLDSMAWNDFNTSGVDNASDQEQEQEHQKGCEVVSLSDNYSTASKNQDNFRDFYIRKAGRKSKEGGQLFRKAASEEREAEGGLMVTQNRMWSSQMKPTSPAKKEAPKGKEKVAERKRKGPPPPAGGSSRPKGSGQRKADLDVTPLPDYQAMFTPELKGALQRFGVKAMPRKKAVTLLNHIYHQTHPGVGTGPPLPEGNSGLPHKPPKRKESPKKPTAKAKSQVDRGKNEARPSKTVLPASGSSSSGSSPEKSNSVDSELEDSMASQTMTSEIKSSLKNFILSNESLHEKILFYEPIVVPEFMAQLREAGLKPTLPTLYSFFDEQGITFTNPRERKLKRIAKRTAKNKKSPQKKSPQKKSPQKKSPQKKS